MGTCSVILLLGFSGVVAGGRFLTRALGKPIDDPQADSEMQASSRGLASAAGPSEVDAPSQVTSLSLPRIEIVLIAGVEELRSAYAVALRNNKLATTFFFFFSFVKIEE